VQVVNTPLPVSVQGTATVAGNVGITGTPTVSATQSGIWNVGLADGAAINVGNTASNPVPVLEAREPVLLTEHAPLGADCPATFFYVVPAGKRLVVEHVSGRMNIPADATPTIDFIWNGSKDSTGTFVGAPSGFVVPQVVGPLGVLGDHNLVAFNHPTRAYADAGKFVGVISCISTFQKTGDLLFSISGYLTPLM